MPSQKLPLYVESPDSVGSSFGYKSKGEVFYHDEKEMMQRMVNTVCTGGNYLLNNGPMGNGKLDPEAVRLYNSIGKWLRLNGESIYNTIPNPFDIRPDWGDVCSNKKGDVLYLHILKYPKTGSISLSGFSGKVASASYLTNGEKVNYKQNGTQLDFTISNNPIDTLDVVIKVILNKPLF